MYKSVNRTTIVLPLKLKQQAVAAARSSGVSFGEFVRRAVEKAASGGAGSKKSPDPFWDDHAVFRGRVPRDLSQHHDRYLYGE